MSPHRDARRPGRHGRPHVALVTDSTASLPPGVAEQWGVVVVPLDVVIGGERRREGVDLASADLAAALESGARVTTSQPAPAAFADVYARLAAAGAREIVSMHLSGDLSGTVRSAQVAALAAPIPVHVVDSRSVVMGLGFAVLSAAQAVRGLQPGEVVASTSGDPVDGSRARRLREMVGRRQRAEADVDAVEVAQRARQVGSQASAWFLVDSLEHLRRGGRLSATAAALGTVLGLRPILTLRDGRIDVAEKVRTRRAARDRLEAVAVAEVRRRGGARVAVHHLGQPDVAAEMAHQLEAWLGDLVGAVEVCEVSAVIGAHVGPGLLAVVVADS
ncbi:DegV family protein [Cellulomonas chengniuliangii]|uniref:DegV family protein n=1 Tax=Cellulomonas chengniuliangii TaxID=2968084 RepID=UPI001D0E2BB6|nr:DegV family protein [Cellulomonas chengniuliangii]MCC2318230.1 DegV family protein [Cellulomonas chengniuliangii]